MEEILQSIRKIIAEDGDDAAPAAAIPAKTSDVLELTEADDVLELTEMVEEPQASAPQQAAPAGIEPSGVDVLSKIDQAVVAEEIVAPVATPAPVAAPTAQPAAQPEAQPMAEKNQAYIDSLLSAEAASAVSSAFKKAHPVEPPIMTTPSPQFRSGGSVEDLVMEALRPMLKQWLDTNLPNIVERIVEREIKKLTD